MKKTILIGLSSLILLLFGSALSAQNIEDIRINEVLVINDSNIVDDYNCRGAWIELFNTAYNTVNIGGCYLTNDRNDKTKFKIIKGSAGSKIAGRSYFLLWADAKPFRGVNHLNFDLRDSDFLALYDADGNIIDSIILKNQIKDVSYGSMKDGEASRGFLAQPTPNGTNLPKEQVTSAQKFMILDPWGIGMAAIAMSVVFLALIGLYLVFKQIALYYTRDHRKKALIKEGKVIEAEQIKEDVTADVNAAIALALHMYNSELHDFEDTILTINKVSRTYSPWSSKIYGLRQMPERRKN